MADNANEAFMQRLLATFRVEAQERIQTLSSALVALDNATDAESQKAFIETIFREVHSLKGAARAVDRRDIEALCQALESVFSALKRGELNTSRNLIDLLLRALDWLERILPTADAEHLGDAQQLKLLCAQLQSAVGGYVAALPPDAAPAESAPIEAAGERVAPAHETMRVTAARIDALLRQAEGMIALKLNSAQRSLDIEALGVGIGASKKDYASGGNDARFLQRALAQNEIDAAHAPALRKLLDMHARMDAHVRNFDAQISLLRKRSARDAAEAAFMVDALLDEIKRTSLQPFSALFGFLPKLVRDLARESGKEIELSLRGGDLEIDRRILDTVRDPITHIVRNAIDHGVEIPAVRTQSNKSPRARLTIEAMQRDGKILLSIADDGAGIDRARVLDAARKLGKLAIADDEQQALALIFESGLSTSASITDISGRGLGLAIVREKIEALGGAVTVASEIGKGTQFRLVLPLTLATYRGVQVSCSGRQFIFPLVHVERVIQCGRDDIDVVQNREVIHWEGQSIALIGLCNLLEVPPVANRDAEKWAVVIAAVGDQHIGFIVDEVIGEQEVIVKNLGPQLRRVRHTAAAAVLGDGKVALILNVLDLFKAAAEHNATPALLQKSESAAAPKSVLVAEDSITSRQLLRGMLEAAGYRVTVAVDGEDAFAKLRAGAFDILISDVDMPHLSGFDLAARVRADAQLKALPVVLVTSLASKDDRERGVDVGANAYIVKSNFEQSNLIDVVRRLI